MFNRKHERGVAGLLRGILCLAGLAVPAHATPTSMSLAQAPREWVVYARSATRTISGWLNGDGAPAPQMRDAIFVQAAERGQQPQPVLLRLWVGGDGAITRLEAPSVGDTQAGKDLRTVLLGQHLARPPRNMLQPMRLMVRLQPPKTGGKQAAAPAR